MRVVREHDVPRFLEQVGPCLRERPSENHLMLGLLEDLARPGAFPGQDAAHAQLAPVLLAVLGPQGVEAVALRTPPRAVLLSRATDEAVDALVAFARSDNLAFPAVIAPEETAERFAAQWVAAMGGVAVLRLKETSYALTQVRHPSGTPGTLRDAVALDEDLLTMWSDAFHRESGMDPPRDTLAFVRNKMNAGQLFVWDDGAPVTMLSWSGRTAIGARVTYVYTPPSQRKRGYASAAVATLSQRLLDAGCPRCFLFADAANATSNKIYQAIGYERACDFRFIDFHAQSQ